MTEAVRWKSLIKKNSFFNSASLHRRIADSKKIKEHNKRVENSIEKKVEIIKEIDTLNPELLKVKDRNGYNAITRAVFEGNTAMIKLFYKLNLFKNSDNPTDINQQLLKDCLIACVRGGNFQLIKQLLLYFCDDPTHLDVQKEIKDPPSIEER